ncbi:MAG: hypothetical protein HFG68_12355 [Hungatella sp.]|nr:hypothetical protein [Hungatella sp.]
MSEFIVKDEFFKLGILDRVPVPNDGECFLLYQTGAGKKSSFIIQNGIRYSSAQIRHGRYNRMATISLNSKSMIQKYAISMRDPNFYFDVMIQVSYILQDIQEYFFSEQIDQEDIHQMIRKVIQKHDREWDIQQIWDAENDLENELEQRLRKYESIKFRIMHVEVSPDEIASKMLQSNRNKIVEIHVAKNETDEKIAKNEQTKRIFDSENELKIKKIQDMAIMIRNFGSLAPVVQEYFMGNMNGTDLYNYISKSKMDDLNRLNLIVSNDLLPQEEVITKLNEILKDNKFFQEEEKQPLLGEKESKIEEIKEETNEDSFSLEDGDYI